MRTSKASSTDVSARSRNPEPLTLLVNGQRESVTARSLAAMLHELGFGEKWLGTAVNGTLVPRGEREGFALCNGDRVEILRPMQGG